MRVETDNVELQAAWGHSQLSEHCRTEHPGLRRGHRDPALKIVRRKDGIITVE